MSHQQIIKLAAVIALTGLSRSSIYLLLSKNEFPKQIKLSTRSMGWLLVEVEAWIAGRVEASRVGA
jgi:prophage regulatory protein